MALKPKDPLLAFARGFITVMMWGSAAFTVLLLVVAPAAWLFREHIIVQVAGRNGHVIDAMTVASGIAVLLMIAAMAALAFLFQLLLRRIIDTVAAGDPFVPENATRLSRMGWLIVALQALSYPAAAADAAMRLKDVDLGFGVSIGALLLALVLFILARVFRTGAAMREELEGTV